MKDEKYKIKQFLKNNNIAKNNISFRTNKDYIFSYFKVINIMLDMVQHSNFDYYNFAEEIVSLLDERIEIDNKENEAEIKKCTRVLKSKAIAKIKSLKKTVFDNDKRLKFLKELTNHLECLEVLYTFSDSKKMIKVEYDFINYVLFEQKNLYHSKELINSFPHLINVLSDMNNSVLINGVNKYIESLLNYVNTKDFSYKEDLNYYNQLIQLLIDNPKIKLDSEELINSFTAIRKTYNDFNTTSSDEKKDVCLWLNHLYKMLNDDGYRPSIDTLRSMYGIGNYFDKSVCDEISLLITEEYDNCDTDDYIITVDGSDTLLRDDALSVKKNEDGNYILKIYISDPNHYFPMDSLTMLEAKNRTQSIYLPDMMEPMFPDLARDKCLSLNEGTSRYARIYEYEIDKYGEVVNFNINKGLITVDKNLTYDDLNEMIFTLNSNSKLNKTICDLFDLKSAIGKHYTNKLEIDGEIKENLTKSEELIGTYMIFNNNKLAKYFSDNHLPFIYRYHKLKNKIEFGVKFEELNQKDRESFEQILNRLEKVNMQAYYSSQNSKHDGLELEAYCHATSPGRQYSGIVVNQCCDMFVFGNPTNKEAYKFIDDLNETIDYLNCRDREILQFYRSYARNRSQK